MDDVEQSWPIAWRRVSADYFIYSKDETLTARGIVKVAGKQRRTCSAIH